MATTNDLKNGMVLNLDGQLWSVVSFQHVKPGKGAAFVRTTLKNVLSGKTLDKTFNAGVKVETENVDRREMTYLYFDGNDYVFMDQDSYDQVSVGSNVIGDMANYMLENSNVVIARHNNEPLYVELPTAVELKVAETTPGVQGDRSQGGTKPAMLETGAEVAVPLFINEGDTLKVDPRDGRYLSRVGTK